MHKLLARQFKRSFGATGDSAVEELLHTMGDDDAKRAALRAFVQGVEEAYTQFDRDIDLSRRSLALSSEEASTANDKLRRDAQRTGRVLATAAVPAIPAPLDLQPKTTEVTLRVPLDFDLTGTTVEVDPEHKLTEITARNNTVKL